MQNVLKALDEVLGQKDRLIEALLVEIAGLRGSPQRHQRWETEEKGDRIVNGPGNSDSNEAKLERQQARSAQFHGISEALPREWIVDALVKADLGC